MIVYTITNRKEIGTVLIRTTTLVLNIIECERIEKVKTKKLNYLTTVILTNEGTDFNINNYVIIDYCNICVPYICITLLVLEHASTSGKHF